MQERLRVEYLSRMGIQSWVPRGEMPHAAASRWLGLDLGANESNSEEAEANPAADSSMGFKSAAGLLNAGAASALTQPPAPQTDAPSPPTTSLIEAKSGADHHPVTELKSAAIIPQSEVQPKDSAPKQESPVAPVDLTPPRFKLEFLRVSEKGVWVFDDHCDVQSVQRFASKVMQAMSGQSMILSQPASFHWPFIESRHEDQSEPVALQALSAQWQFLADQGVSYCISFGESSLEWLNKIKVSPHYHHQSLRQTFTEAESKRALWYALRKLDEL